MAVTRSIRLSSDGLQLENVHRIIPLVLLIKRLTVAAPFPTAPLPVKKSTTLDNTPFTWDRQNYNSEMLFLAHLLLAAGKDS